LSKFISIFNDIIGPVMRGPSSSHTAGSYFIAKLAVNLFDKRITAARFTFDPRGSYAQTYIPLGVDKAFVVGILGWELSDDRFFHVLDLIKKMEIKFQFNISPLPQASHPNTVLIELFSKNYKPFSLVAESIGGGAILIKKINEWALNLDGKSHDLLLEIDKSFAADITRELRQQYGLKKTAKTTELSEKKIYHYLLETPLNIERKKKLKKITGILNIWYSDPLFFKKKGQELFESALEMELLAEKKGLSLAEIALEFEADLLKESKTVLLEEMIHRFRIMENSVKIGLKENNLNLLLTRPAAKKLFQSESEGKTAIGGIHTRAAAKAMAVMQVDNSMGIVCAAPTGGSAGVIPGVLSTLYEEKNISERKAALLLFASAAIGLIIAKRATFAAEIAGCQVEIGAASAMAAAAVVEFGGGTPKQAIDAAAIALQNSMGSVCDPVQGACEIPCITRNAAAVSNAFLCADLILGGYENPIPLDETIDAVMEVGKMMPRELRCTALGGIAATPSAKRIKKKR
jgi:L-serine dehydratase